MVLEIDRGKGVPWETIRILADQKRQRLSKKTWIAKKPWPMNWNG